MPARAPARRSRDGIDLPCLVEVIGERDLFCALYSDRGSHYFYTPKAGEKVSRTAEKKQAG
jgi:hypothetical protein